jgi:4-hydroxybenzoyl-CoA thioesterase
MPYRTQVPVRFGDVDRAGIVYFPRIFHYLHIAQEEFFLHLAGIPYHRLIEDEKMGFPTVADSSEFLKPLRYGDILDVSTFISRVGDSSVTFEFRIHRHGSADLLVSSSQVKVAVNLETLQKVTIPQKYRMLFEACREGDGS